MKKPVPQRGLFRRQGRDPGGHQQIPPSRAVANRLAQQKGNVVKKIALALFASLVLALIANLPTTGTVSVVEASGPCRLDKIVTLPPQPRDVQQHAIEIGGGGFQHWDLYPMPGKRTVSYITERSGRVAIYSGFGSGWEGANIDTCGEWHQYDWVGDATSYQIGRGPEKGSGLVVNVNVRDHANLLVIHVNAFGLSHAEVCGIIAEQTGSWKFDNTKPIKWELHEIGMGDCGGGSPPPVAQVVNNPVPSSTTGGNGCEPAQRTDMPLNGPATWWTPDRIGSGWVIVNFWTNAPGRSQAERTVLLPPGQAYEFFGGGSSWFRPAHCEAEAKNEYSGASLPKVDIQTLVNEGLARPK